MKLFFDIVTKKPIEKFSGGVTSVGFISWKRLLDHMFRKTGELHIDEEVGEISITEHGITYSIRKTKKTA